jgi:hypothetical protein
VACALQLPVEQVSVAELEWFPRPAPVAAENGQQFVVRPHEVRASPGEHPTQWRRPLACDLSRPLHLAQHQGRR